MTRNFKKAFERMWYKVRDDWGGWFMFFVLIYIISFIKLTTDYRTAQHGTFFTVYSILIGIYILSRFLLAYFHKSIAFDQSYEPSVTFVVPAKNEENNIYETIRRFGEVDYPSEKIEVIAVNDGSTDGTLSRMHLAQDDCAKKGINVNIVDWKVNRGKREGMAEGVRLAKNEIVIF